MGIMNIYQSTASYTNAWSTIPYYSLSLSLNVILTLMIIIRIALHTRNTRTAMGITGVGGLCTAIITMLIESCALYAASVLLVIGSWAARNPIENFFGYILPPIQVRAFARLRSSDRFSDLTMDWTGHRSTPHHSTSRQQECVDEPNCRIWAHQRIQSCDSGGVDGR